MNSTVNAVEPLHFVAQEYKILCDNANTAQHGQNVNGWQIVDKHKKPDGFRATSYQKGNKVVICFIGTNAKSAKDHGANFKMATFGPSSQMESAQKYYKNVAENIGKDFEIELAGHSEGGSEATYVGLINDKKTYTYNAYGLTKKSIKEIEKYHHKKVDESLIFNYRDPNDPISKMKKNVGQTFIVDSPTNWFEDNTPFGWYGAHKIKNMGDCTKAIPINEYKKKNEHFVDEIKDEHMTIEDIKQMDDDTFLIYEDEINERLINKEITDNSTAQQMALGGKLIYINEYKRDDGTKVRGHWRRIG